MKINKRFSGVCNVGRHPDSKSGTSDLWLKAVPEHAVRKKGS